MHFYWTQVWSLPCLVSKTLTHVVETWMMWLWLIRIVSQFQFLIFPGQCGKLQSQMTITNAWSFSLVEILKLKFGLFFNIMLVKIGVRTYDTTYTLHSHFSEILNPWVHTSEYASVCCAFGNVYHPGHPKVTISYFASFYLSHSISWISYFSFSDDFFINLLFCTFCNFSGE